MVPRDDWGSEVVSGKYQYRHPTLNITDVNPLGTTT